MDLRSALKTWINHQQEAIGVVNKKEGVAIEIIDGNAFFYDYDQWLKCEEDLGIFTIQQLISLDWELLYDE